MSFVSKLAMAAAISLGTVTLGAAPAVAQKKAEKNAGPDLKVSDAFRKSAAKVEPLIAAKDWATAEPALVEAETVAKNEDERYYAAFLRLKLELGRGSEDGQLKALNTLINNPKTPEETKRVYSSAFNYSMGVRASRAKNNAETIQYLLKAREFGSTDLDVPILLANAYAQTGNNAESIVEVERAIALAKANGQKAPEAWYQFAIPKVNATGDRAAMASWLSRYINEYPTMKNWHWAVSVYAGAGDSSRNEKLAIFRLKRLTNSLPNRGDYADYAYLAQQAGLPWEGVAVIDEGRKNGKIPAGDADTARTYQTVTTQVKSEGSLDGAVKAAQSAADGRAAFQTANALLASGDYKRAIELYDLSLSKGGANADEANLNRGLAFQYLGQKEEARAAYAKVTGAWANLALLYTTSIDLPALT